MDDRERTIRTISDHLARAMLAAVEYSERHGTPGPPTHIPAQSEPAVRIRGQLLTLDELAEVLQVSVDTVRQWRKTGYGPQAFRVGKYLRWKPEVVQAWIDAQSA